MESWRRFTPRGVADDPANVFVVVKLAWLLYATFFCHCERKRSNLICYCSFQGLLQRLVPYKNRWDCFANLCGGEREGAEKSPAYHTPYKEKLEW